MCAPTLYVVTGTLSLDVYCVLVALALVLAELADIKDELTKLNN